ncbi:ATP-binding cassette domain-containing protein [Clostridium botulinum]|nr:ATP-binding cassette domain-containing protein [Clostridium botulinum]
MRKIDIISNKIMLELMLNDNLDGRKTMKIKSIAIEGIGGIKKLNLEFNNGLNLICGTNGIGKTTILEAISHCFTNTSDNINVLKKHVGYDSGKATLEYELGNSNIIKDNYEIREFIPYKHDEIYKTSEYSLSVLFFNTDRRLEYQKLSGIMADEQVNKFSAARKAKNGVDSSNCKSWFINRYLFSKQEKGLSNEQVENLNLALNVFSILDKEIVFSTIIPDTLDILVNTPQGEIYLEYLSAGYKSCFYILLGIIKEIEFRFKEPRIKVIDFDGVIMIDEIDLHLHPEWQAQLIIALKKMLPKAQVIATTHSPNMIQSVLPNEIIPLALDENGDVYKKDLKLGQYGLQGWTIEEILTDVMGLRSTSSELYLNTIKAFDKAMDEDDVSEIKKYYNILNEMLHHNNPIRKILKIQMAGYEE